jgi:FkbM family methyltransferase
MTLIEKIIYKIRQLANGYLLRNPDDLLALEYIREDRKHDFRHRYDLLPGDIVFDLGAHKGDWSKRIISMYPGCIVHLFELLPVYAEDLAEQFRNFDNVTVNDFGLSAREAEVSIAEDGLSSSAFNHTSDSKVYIGKLKSFEEYVLSKSINKIKLMKMNIEGGEYDLLEGVVGTQRISQIENLQIQFHNYGQEYVLRRDKIRQELSKTHYLTYDYAWTFENWRLKAD